MPNDEPWLEVHDGLLKVVDVAEYVLEQYGPMPTMKLHKLLYYCQAWSLVTQDRPMFDLDFQAWASGPVIPELYELHKGKFLLRHGEIYEALDGRSKDVKTSFHKLEEVIQ